MHFFGLLKIFMKKCSETIFFTAYYERRLFSSFALAVAPLAPSWPPLRARHKTYGFYRTGWPSPFQNPRKMHTFALGLPGGLYRREPSGRHLGPILGRLGHTFMASWGILHTRSTAAYAIHSSKCYSIKRTAPSLLHDVIPFVGWGGFAPPHPPQIDSPISPTKRFLEGRRRLVFSFNSHLGGGASPPPPPP